MEYTLLFDLSEVSRLPYFTATGVFSGLFIVAASLFAGGFNKTVHPHHWTFALWGAFAIVFLYFAVSTGIASHKMVDNVFGEYEKGESCVVEGVVENCDTPSFYKEGRGTFTVDGVTFDYGRTTGLPGYRGKNNLIYENGQQVKIHYIPFSDQNLIVRIEAVVD